MADRGGTARFDFHAALAALIVPVLTLPVGLTLIAWQQRGPKSSDELERRWRMRLRALVAVDAVLTIAMFAVVATGRAAKVLEAPRRASYLGVELDPPDGLTVSKVLPGGRAAQAGVSAGDRLLALDGEPVADRGALLKRLRAAEGRPAELRWKSSASERHASIEVPKLGPADDGKHDLAAWLVPALALCALSVFGFVRGARGWLLAPALVVGCLAIDGGTALLLLRSSMAGLLERWPMLPLLAGAAMLVPAGYLALRFLERRGLLPDEAPPERVGRTALLGLLYAFGFGWRAGIALVALIAFGVPWLQGVTTADLFSGAGEGGFPFLVVAAVVLAPLGEELVFRGALLGWLRTFTSDALAIALSTAAFALLHWHYRGGMLTVAAYGAALGWARVRSRSLGAPILLHTMINGLTALLVLARR